MTTKLLTLTLLATTLTLNAATFKEVRLVTQQRSHSISTIIASVLHKRGLEEDKALELSKELIGEKEELFSLMINNFLNATTISHEELFAELGKLALSRKKVDFSSYSFLVRLQQTLQTPHLNEREKAKLARISTNNQLLYKVFA